MHTMGCPPFLLSMWIFAIHLVCFAPKCASTSSAGGWYATRALRLFRTHAVCVTSRIDHPKNHLFDHPKSAFSTTQQLISTRRKRRGKKHHFAQLKNMCFRPPKKSLVDQPKKVLQNTSPFFNKFVDLLSNTQNSQKEKSACVT